MAAMNGRPHSSGWSATSAIRPRSFEVHVPRLGRAPVSSLPLNAEHVYDVSFHGKHPAPAGMDAVSVQWAPCDRRTSRIRVRDYTCECLPVVFEFCVAAGLAFIRRRQRSDSQLLVTESDWTTRRLADALWADIMRGKAQ